MRDPLSLAREIRARVLPPPPRLTVSGWADTYRRLSPEISAEPGRWRTDRAPHLREIMDTISDPAVENVVLMCSARVGKSEAINNAIGYFTHQDPCPMLVVYPTVESATAWSKERLSLLIRDTPELAERIVEKARDSSNTQLLKQFAGGFIAIAGSNSPSQLASRTCRAVFFDEVDKFCEDTGMGDPIDLAVKRTQTYVGRRKHVYVSTPGIKGESRIEKAFNTSDMRKRYVPCPHCDEFHLLEWKNVVWPEGKPWEAVLACPVCGGEITESHRPGMLRKGVWRATREALVPGTVGFHLNELYSPWSTLAGMAQSFVTKVAGGPAQLQTFVNESLGETWDLNHGQAADAEGLMKRARDESYVSGTVPDGVGLLVASVDIQTENPQRLELLVRGFGAGMEAWTVEHVEIPGNLLTDEPWDVLESYLKRSWPRVSGGSMRVRVCAIDTGGHFDKQVYKFRRERRDLTSVIYPIKGATTPQAKLVLKSKKVKGLHLVDTVSAKDDIYSSLKIAVHGGGFQHFPCDTEQYYFDELLTERATRKSGRRAYEQVKAGRPNEILDLHVYCLAAVSIFAPKDLKAMVSRAGQAMEMPKRAPDPEMAEHTATDPVAAAVNQPEPAPDMPRRVVRVVGRPQPSPQAVQVPTTTPRPMGGGSGAW